MCPSSQEIERSLVAFIDLLGLKNQILDDFVDAFIILETFQRILFPLVEARRKALHALRVFSFSDAVILVLPVAPRQDSDGHRSRADLNDNAIIQFGTLVSDLMSDCMIDNIPLRGAISIGNVMTSPEMAVWNQQFVSGAPLIEAYQFENQQNWVGVSFCRIEHIPRQRMCDSVIEILQEKKRAVEYDVPIEKLNMETCEKEQSFVQTHAICWDTDKLGLIIEKVESLARAARGTQEAVKYENTLNLLNLQLSWNGGRSNE